MPLFVFAGIAEEDYLAEWHRHIGEYCIVATLFSLLLILFGLFQRRSDEALRNSEEKLRGLFELSPLGIILNDMQGRFIDFNDAFKEICGYSAKELCALDYWALTPEKYKEDEARQLASLERTGCYGPYEKEYIRKDGSLIALQFNGMLIKGNQGQKYIWSIVENITERKRVAELLRHSSSEIEDLYNNAPCGYHSLNKDGVICQINDTELEWLGYTRDEVVGKLKWVDLITLDGLKTFRENYPIFIKQGVIHDLEFEMVRKNGSQFTGLINATAIYDTHGVFVMSRSTVVDITKRKQLDTELRIAAISFETQKSMLVTDANGAIMRVNHAFTEMTGYTAAEVMGQTPRVLKSGRHESDFYEMMWDSIYRTGGWQGEIWNQRKNGEIYPEHLTITAVKGDNGEINHFVATMNDITERKRAEERLRESEARYKRIALHLDNVREEERVRIARELHDEMGATLTALKMHVHWLASCQPGEVIEFTAEVAQINKLVSDAVITMRHVVCELMPILLHDLGFSAAVEHYVQDFQRHTGLDCRLALPEDELILDENQSSTLFRILQESLTNVAKHAQATKVSILFIERNHSLILMVKDNGVGFNKLNRKNISFGLLSIRERAQMVNGKARISSQPGEGTQVLISIPLIEKLNEGVNVGVLNQ